MLEPLIVLTVLNCFFMFSSTVTTCALWWQYRSHRCCFRRDSTQQGARHNLTRRKSNNNNDNNNDNSNNNSWAMKKSANSKHRSANSIERSKSNSSHESNARRCRRNSRQKPDKSSKYLAQSKAPSDERLSSLEIVESWELEDGTRMSEASQTGAEAKPAVVMEYSTVQKIVQILDDGTDLTATKMVIKDLANRQNAEEKKEYVIVREDSPQFESQTEYGPVTQVQFAT